MDKYKLPQGFKDYLPKESYKKNIISDTILKVFEGHNYKRIETPTIEYYNMYSHGVAKVSEENLLKLSDTDGRILVLRPDITLSVCRAASTKIKPSYPVKYCYLGNSFTLKQDRYRLREFTQAGVELINEPSVFADAEMIALAIEALKKTGLQDFLVDIGQVAFFKGIIEGFNISLEDKNEIAELIYRKDIIGVSDLINGNNSLNGSMLKDNAYDSGQLDILLRLPTLFGGREILDQAERFPLNNVSLNAIDNLKQIYDLLDKRGLSGYISFDLSLVNSMNYYSGMVFKGITRYLGAPILAGGRYDKLSSSFSADIPSTGFAIGVDNLYLALQCAGTLPEDRLSDYVIFYDKEGFLKATEAADELRLNGMSVNTLYYDNVDALNKMKESMKSSYSNMITIAGDYEEQE